MDNTVDVLNKLITISKDGEEGFKLAADHIKDSGLKTNFLQRAEGCKKAVEELQKHVVSYKEEPEESGSTMGAIHRGWVNLKSMIAEYDEGAIIEECLKGEEVAKEAYEDALKEELPNEIRTIIQSQYEGLMKNYDFVKNLKHDYKKPE